MKDITISLGARNYAVLELEASRMGVDAREYVYDLVMMDVYRNLRPRGAEIDRIVFEDVDGLGPHGDKG